MKLTELFAALADIAREKDIEYSVLLDAIRLGIMAAYKKTYHANTNIDVIVDDSQKKIQIIAKKIVVENVEDDTLEISPKDAKKISPEAEVGDTVEIEVTPPDFGRFAASTCKQIIMQRLKEAEKDKVIKEYSDKEKDMVFGEVSRVTGENVYFNLGKAEGLLPKQEQIPGEPYTPGRKFHCFVLRVDRSTREPLIILSRTHPNLLAKLMELEIPEIMQGVIEIIGIVREPGVRAKVAVHSNQSRVDPVGSCIGSKGVRINVISDELKGERIDVLRWFEDPRLFVASSLSPAKVYSVQIFQNEKRAVVAVSADQFSLAIGKKGSNVRLASRLTGYKIDMKVMEE